MNNEQYGHDTRTARTTRDLTVIRGSGGGGKGGGGGQTAKEDPTSLQSNQIVTLIDLICEGPIMDFATSSFQSVFLNGTPLTNPDGTENFAVPGPAFNFGWPNQGPLPGLANASQVFEQNILILAAVPQTFTLSANSVDAVVVTLGVQGLLVTDTTTGDIHGTTVNFHVDIKPQNGAWGTAFSDAISGKTNSNYARDYRLELPSSQGPWQVRVVRDTPDSTSTALVNALYLVAYTEIGELNLSYPNSVVVGWTVSAQQFGSSIPTRSYRIKGKLLQIPSNYDPATRSYAGAFWDGTFKTAWSDNPAWVIYDILTNARYGLGKRIDASLVDKFSLYAIAQYCDQYVPDGYGGFEPRFRFNGVLSQQSDAYQVLQSIAANMRGMIYWSAGAIFFTQDSPKTVKKLFSPANVINGQFDYQSSALKDRHSVARVIWNDPNNHFQQAVEVVEHPDALQRFGWRTVDIQATGTTSRGQAHRIGKWMLDTEFSESETITFSCTLQEADLMPGDIIDVADPAVAGSRFGGRVISNVGTLMVVDAPVTLYGNDTVMAIAPDGVTVWQVAVGSADGLNPTAKLAMQSPFSAPILANSMFLMSSPTLAPRQFRIVSITETAVGTWQIAGLYYDFTKYERIEDGIQLPQPNYSILPSGPLVPPTNVTCVESLFQMNSTIVSRLIVSWTPSTDARVSGYDIFAASPGGNMQWYGRSTVSSFDIDTVALGGWTFNIYSSSLLGDSYSPAVGYHDVLGKFLPPNDVTGLGFTFDPTIGVVLTWAPNTDVDLSLYEVRKLNSVGTFDGAYFLGQVKGSNFALPPGSLHGGTGTYMVKAISIVGNESVNAASIFVQVPAAAAPVITGTFVGTDCVFTWNTPTGPFAINYYEVRTDQDFGDPEDPLQLIGQVKGNTIKVKAQWSGPRDFFISAFDVANDYGGIGQVTMTIVLASAPVITASVIDNNVLLRWTSTAGTLPIDHFEVRKGSTWASAAVVGNTSGTFDVLFETSSGTYTYWIAAVDTAGNYGKPSSVSATVSQPPDYILLYNYNSTFGGTQVNSVIDGDGGLVMPVDITSTYEQHFTNNRIVATSTWTPQSWLATGCIILDNNIDDVDGNIAASTMTVGAAGNDFAYKVLSGLTAGAQVTYSIMLRRRAGKGSGNVTLRLRNNSTSVDITATSFAVTASWVRYSVTGTVPAGQTAVQVLVDPDTNTGNAGWVLDIDKPQLATGAAPLPYWGNPQDQINAGFNLFIEPGAASASYSEFIDYGTHLPSTKFTVTPTSVIVAGNPNLQCDIQTSLDNVTWTDFPGVFQTFVTNFRYAKITLTATGAGADLIKLSGLNIRFDVKQKTDGGTVLCAATDVAGTPAYFTAGFIDVQSLTVSGQGTVALFAIYDFVDIPYPVSFSIYLFDKNGNRLSGNASWTARGV